MDKLYQNIYNLPSLIPLKYAIYRDCKKQLTVINC